MAETTWMNRAAAAAAVLTVTTAVLTPVAGAASTATPTHENRIAAAAITTVTAPDVEPSTAAAAIPADFAAVLGYQPVVIDGMLTDPNGDCSSPVTLPVEFDTACKAHDLGYDLLRYADKSGAELGTWARIAVDEQLGLRMHDACGERESTTGRFGCYAMADIASGFVDGNSWRQGYVSPRPEPLGSYLIAALVAMLLMLSPRAFRVLRQSTQQFGYRSVSA